MQYYALFKVGSKDPIQSFSHDDAPFYTQEEAEAYLDEITKDRLWVNREDYEVRLWKHIPSVLRVTSAPVDYDGFGTRTVYTYALADSGRTRTFRTVDIQVDHLDWQTCRYASGLHTPMTVTEWEAFKNHVEAHP